MVPQSRELLLLPFQEWDQVESGAGNEAKVSGWLLPRAQCGRVDGGREAPNSQTQVRETLGTIPQPQTSTSPQHLLTPWTDSCTAGSWLSLGMAPALRGACGQPA